MKLEQIKEKLQSQEYDFLRQDKNLGNNIIILTLGGSHAYGTDTENSDLDIRGCALNSKMQILTNEKFEQFVNEDTDTTIYAFNKLISLLCNCNPNVIEQLGNKPEHYFYVSPIGRELLDNAHLFLSKRAINSFGGYASAQLRRLDNKVNRLIGQAQNEEHIYKTIEHAAYDFRERYFTMPDDAIKLYIDKAVQEGYDTEIFMDVNLYHYPLRDYADMWSEMKSIVKSYAKIGKRNEKAIDSTKWNAYSLVVLKTKAEYDAIQSKDDHTFYAVLDNESGE